MQNPQRKKLGAAMGGNAPIYIVLGIILGAGVTGVGYGAAVGWDANLWLGTKPVLDYILGFLTIVVAVTVAILSVRTFRLNADTAAAGRFQKGVELLSEDSEVSRTGGQEVLFEVARSYPKLYLSPIVRTFSAYIFESSFDYWEECERVQRLSGTVVERKLTGATFRVFNALFALMHLTRRWRRRHGFATVQVLRPVLHGVVFHDTWLSDVTIVDAYLGDITFQDCKIENLSIDATVMRRISFERCGLKNVTLQLRDCAQTMGHSLVTFKDTRTFEKVTLNKRIAITSNGDY